MRAVAILLAGLALAFSLSAEARAQGTNEAFDRYRLAAAKGDAAALNGLGAMFQAGNGVPTDAAKAYALFHLAASLPNGDGAQRVRAAQNRDALAGRMTQVELANAQQLFALCYGNDINLCGERIISSGGVIAAAPAREGLSVSLAGKTVVPLENANGVYVVPVVVNGALTLKFAVDTGASDVSIPADVVSNLMQAGLLSKDDLLGEQTYILADGSRRPSQTLRLRSLKLGDILIQNVKASIVPEKAPLLLGQSFFGRLKSWSLDNARHALIIE
jgi:clan AA aspartic protease (TIGR02281 family)